MRVIITFKHNWSFQAKLANQIENGEDTGINWDGTFETEFLERLEAF